MRRRHEPRGVIGYMASRTYEQPNFRLYRSLRHLQGLDYLHTLRGLRDIDFFDFDRWLECKQIVQVRDWTFVQDVKNSVSRDKSLHDKQISQIRNLAPNFPGHTISEEAWQALESVMKEEQDQLAARPPSNGHVPVGLQPIVIEDSSSSDTEMGEEFSDDDSISGEGSDNDATMQDA